MRIALLIPEFPSQTHAFFWREARALADLGCDVRFVSTRRPDRQACPHEFAAMATEKTTYLFPPRLSTLSQNLWRVRKCIAYTAGMTESTWKGKSRALALGICAAELVRYCKANAIDHVHVHSCADAAHVAAMARLMGGSPYSLHLHGDLPVYGRDHRSKMQFATFVSADARPMQQQAIDVVGLAPARTSTIWMGVDTDRFVPPPSHIHDHTVLRVVTVARLHRAKGHVHALRAVAEVVRRGRRVHYTIAGGGPERNAIEAEIARLHLGERVALVGALSEAEIISLLQRCDVYVLPSVGEGEASPVAVMEAMACGVPVVCSIIGGTPDMISSGVDGILIGQGDETALTDALVRLADEPLSRVAMGRAARERAVRQFDSRASAAKLLKCIMQHSENVAR